MDEGSAARYRAAELAFWGANGAQPEERWVDVPEGECRVRLLESGNGRPILFVHGATGAASVWAPLAARIRDRRCLVLDRPGCGLSTPSARDPASGAAVMTAVQVAVLDALGIDRLDMVGSSYGGASVLWLTEAHPERVDHIVLEGAPALAGIRPTGGFRTLASPLGALVARATWTKSNVETAFAGLGEHHLVDAGWFEGAALAWALALENDTDTIRNERTMLRSILGFGLGGFNAARLVDPAQLAAIDRPTLWLWGKEDPLATVTQGSAWASSMAHAQFEVLEGVGHFPWLGDPEGHVERVERFLAG